MWNIPLTDKGGLASLRTADWFKYSKPIPEGSCVQVMLFYYQVSM